MTNGGSTVSALELADAITVAARSAFSDLFREHPGEYYYCSLVTTGEGLPPVVSAWSRRALDVAAARYPEPARVRASLKWSWAESPYLDYGKQHFEAVRRLFAQRPAMTTSMSEDEWLAELNVRIDAMEAAIARLDSENLFGDGQRRQEIVILAEVVPGDYTNTARAKRLNSPDGALREWLAEASED